MGIWKGDRLMSSQWPEGQHAWRMMNKYSIAPDRFREMKSRPVMWYLTDYGKKKKLYSRWRDKKGNIFLKEYYPFEDITLASGWGEQGQKPQTWKGQALLWPEWRIRWRQVAGRDTGAVVLHAFGRADSGCCWGTYREGRLAGATTWMVRLCPEAEKTRRAAVLDVGDRTRQFPFHQVWEVCVYKQASDFKIMV